MWPQPRQEDLARGGRDVARPRDEPVVLGPRECERYRDLGEAGEAPGPHAGVDRLEAGRVRVGAHQRERGGVGNALGMRDRRAQRHAPPARGAQQRRQDGPQRPREHARLRPLGHERLRPQARGRDRGDRLRVPGERQLERHPTAQRVARHVRPVEPERQRVSVHGPREVARRDGRAVPPRASAARPAAPPRAASRAIAPSGGDSPKPGRSIAITSRWAARRSITGSHMRRSVPSAWISTSGGPLPRRV